MIYTLAVYQYIWWPQPNKTPYCPHDRSFLYVFDQLETSLVSRSEALIGQMIMDVVFKWAAPLLKPVLKEDSEAVHGCFQINCWIYITIDKIEKSLAMHNWLKVVQECPLVLATKIWFGQMMFLVHLLNNEFVVHFYVLDNTYILRKSSPVCID